MSLCKTDFLWHSWYINIRKLNSRVRMPLMSGLLVVGTCCAASAQVSGSPEVYSPFVSTSEPASFASPVVYSAGSSTNSPAVTPSVYVASPNSNAAPASHWMQQLEDAGNNLREETLPDPVQAKMKLETAVDQLQRYLSPQTNENGARWLAFLRWNELMKELSAAKPNLKTLDQLELNMRQNYPGLELQPFVEVRNSIDQYTTSLRYSSDRKRTIERLRQQLKNLSESLQTAPSGADAERQREIGLVLHYLDEAKQASSLVNVVRAQFSKPNFRLLASESFLRSSLNRPVSQPNPVNEVILGTQITGTSCLVGNVSPRLVENSNSATLRMELLAQFSSDNRGTNRGVTIYSQGSSPVQVAESIQLTDYGLQALNDTSVFTDLDTDVTGIQHRLRIVRKIAAKQVAKKSGEANAIGEGRLQDRLGTQFHSQLAEQLSETNGRLNNRDMSILNRLGLARPSRTSWSSMVYLGLLWKQQMQAQLAAPSSCPLPVENSGITAQLHQSLIQNLLDPVLGGRVIRNTDLDDFALQVGNKVPDAITKEASQEAWSIALAAFHPVEVEFDNNRIKMRIRCTNLTRGDQELDEAATIEAVYRVEVIGNAIQLYREGPVDIRFPAQSSGLKSTALRSFLKKKFDGVFRETLLDKPATPLDRLPPGSPSLSIVSVQMDDGWMQFQLR